MRTGKLDCWVRWSKPELLGIAQENALAADSLAKQRVPIEPSSRESSVKPLQSLSSPSQIPATAWDSVPSGPAEHTAT